MKSTLIILQGFAAASVLAQEYTRCYTPITGNPPPELDTEISRSDIEKRGLLDFEVDTYVHVITSEAKEGMYPQSMVEEQVGIALVFTIQFSAHGQ